VYIFYHYNITAYIARCCGYSEFTASGLWDDGDFVATDRIVIKSYANRIAGGSDPVYQFQFGGASPVRTLLPVPFSVVDAGYELRANKQNDLTPDGTGTKYPTVDAVNAVLPTSYSKIVYVNATSPTTATIFDLENPPVTNDNLLKNDTANLYIGTDASTWVYLTGTGYVTKIVPSTSNFNTFGTTVDAGNSKTSHITRSGPVTLTGSLNLAVAKISTTPNTSAGSYDILTRNSSTTALEKKLISDFLQTTGNQSFTGTKSGTSTTAIPTGITLVNENNFTGATVANFTNSATSSINSTSALIVSNDNSGSATSAIQIRNNSSGFGGFFKNLSTGIGVFFENWSSGIGFQFDSRTGSTGDLLRFTKNNATTTNINHLGEIVTMTPTASGQVATKSYTDAKITQTITNGVTDKSPSEDAIFDALSGHVKNIVKDAVPSTAVTGTLSETILKSYLIPTNTFSSSDLMNIPVFAVNKVGVVGTANIKIYINTTNSLSGAVQLVRYNMGNTLLRVGVDRHFRINGGNLMGLQFTSTTLLTDIGTSTAVESSTPITVSSDFYIITTATLSDVTDSISQSTFLITN